MAPRALSALCLVLAAATSVSGQRPNRRPGMQPQAARPRTITLDGTVQAVQRRTGLVSVKTAAEEVWLLRITPKTEVRVTGEADPSVLRGGLFVRFLATVHTRRGRTVDKVSRLTVFTATGESGREIGAFPPSPGGGDELALPPDKRPDDPDARPPRSDAEKPRPRADSRGNDATKQFERTFDIRGRIRAVKKVYMTVEVPTNLFKSPLRVELADNLRVALDLKDYSIIGPGDKIQARGAHVAERGVEARTVNVELGEIYGAPKKKTKRAPTRAPGRAKAREGKEPGDGLDVADEIEQAKRGAPAKREEPADGDQPAAEDRPKSGQGGKKDG